MGILTYNDLITNQEFRNYVEHRLASRPETKGYSFGVISRLYKYRALSEYAVEDIVNNQLTASNVSEFNDIYDGAIHYSGTLEECEKRAEQIWGKLEDLDTQTGIFEILKRDEMIKLIVGHYHMESRLKFRVASFVGTYVCSLSANNNSTLMWSHYANSNTGICVEYDFSKSNIVFPVAYSKEPIDIADLIEDDSNVFDFPTEAALQCAVLNKSSIWEYENEWRVVMILPVGESRRRISLKTPSKVYSIALGYHFLKPFFYFQGEKKETAQANIKNLNRLLNYVKENSIPLYVMVPSIGEYIFKRVFVDINDLILFMHRNFINDEPENIQYYDNIHDELMDMLEKC